MNVLDILIIIPVAMTVDVIMVSILWHLLIKRYSLQPFVRMAKQFASQNGVKSQQVQHQRKQVIKNKDTEEKLLNGLIDELPMGGAIKSIMERQGLSGTDVFGALQDENFIKGVMVLYKTFGSLISKVVKKDDVKPSNGDYAQSY